ncbi:Cell division cycle protein 27 B, partial [Tetrabaena socialis]
MASRRLYTDSRSLANQQLLGTCYMHCNQAYRAYHLLKGQNSQRSRYLLAVCCVSMGRYPEAKDALLRLGEAEIPHGAAGLYLLGKVCRLTSCMSEAKDYYFRALRLNPLLWAAYEELCAVGGDEEAAEVCSLAQLPPPAVAEGPSPSTCSQVSSALAQHQQHPHPHHHHQQQHPHHHQQQLTPQHTPPPQQQHHHHHPGQGHPPLPHGRVAGGRGPGAKDPGRTAAQQHHPGGPAGTSGAPAPAPGGFLRGAAGAPGGAAAGAGGPATGGSFGFLGFGAAAMGQAPPSSGGGFGPPIPPTVA